MKKPLIAALAFAGGMLVATAGRGAPPLLGSTSLTWEQIWQSGNSTTGLSHRFFQNPTATLDELEMHVTDLPPGKAPHAPHTHPEEELLIIKEGPSRPCSRGRPAGWARAR